MIRKFLTRLPTSSRMQARSYNAVPEYCPSSSNRDQESQRNVPPAQSRQSDCLVLWRARPSIIGSQFNPERGGPCSLRHREPRPSTWSGRFKSFRWDYVLGKALHLFQLGAALQQEKVNANRIKLANAYRNLAGCADKSVSQSSITNGVIFERNMLV